MIPPDELDRDTAEVVAQDPAAPDPTPAEVAVDSVSYVDPAAGAEPFPEDTPPADALIVCGPEGLADLP